MGSRHFSDVRTFNVGLVLALFLTACSSSDSDSSGTGGTPGSGGSPAKGGSGGSSSGGSGGSSTTGGSGGASTSGGAGGSASGGASGSGGAKADAGGGSGGSKSDAAGDGGGAAPLPPSNSPLTAGFTMTPFTYNIQSPYRTPQAERYTFDQATNTHTMWVKSDDSSFQAGNGTDPRTELRWREEYTSGQHMLESDLWIGGMTDRTSIMQVFSTSPPTTFMLTAWADKTLRYYFGTGNGPVIMTDAFEKWFNLKVLHDVAAKTVTVYINDVKSMSFRDKGSHWHFKNGNYGCRSARCETRWRNLRYWVKK